MSDDGDWIRNPGYRLSFVDGRRLYVRLRNGMQPAEPWAADWIAGHPGCCFTLRGHPYDIVAFRLAA